MKKQVTVKVLKAHSYDHKHRAVGDEYVCHPQLAIALKLARRVLIVEPDATPKKGTYKRRDMRAEPLS